MFSAPRIVLCFVTKLTNNRSKKDSSLGVLQTSIMAISTWLRPSAKNSHRGPILSLHHPRGSPGHLVRNDTYISARPFDYRKSSLIVSSTLAQPLSVSATIPQTEFRFTQLFRLSIPEKGMTDNAFLPPIGDIEELN